MHGCALVHMQGHIGITFDECADRFGQRVTRLGVGGCDRQGAFFLVGVLLGNLLDTFNLAQHLTSRLEYRLSRRSHVREMLTTAGKNLYSQLILQQTYLFAYTRL